MSLSGHLKELRNRLILCVVIFLVVSVLALGKAQQLVTVFTDMGEQYGYVYVYIAPQELLMQYFKVSLIAGVCLTMPVILYEGYAFARPGLTRRENFLVAFSMVFGLLCFIAGVAFAYYVTLPFMLKFLIDLGAGSLISASISVESYLNFVMTVFVIFGFVFEMPLLSMILSRIGLLTPALMRKWRTAAIVLIFILAAVITPPDIFSQVMVALPMLVLYEFSILLSALTARFRRSTQKDSAENSPTIP